MKTEKKFYCIRSKENPDFCLRLVNGKMKLWDGEFNCPIIKFTDRMRAYNTMEKLNLSSCHVSNLPL